MKRTLEASALSLFFAAALAAAAEKDPFADGKACERTKKGEGRQLEAFQQRKFRGGVIEKWKKNNPEKYEELKKLKEENPEAFKEKIREMAKERMGKFRAEKAEIEALAAKYKESGSEDDKNVLKEKLRQQMQKRLKAGRARISEMEENLAKFKARLEETEKNLDAKIEERIEKMLKVEEKR